MEPFLLNKVAKKYIYLTQLSICTQKIMIIFIKMVTLIKKEWVMKISPENNDSLVKNDEEKKSWQKKPFLLKKANLD